MTHMNSDGLDTDQAFESILRANDYPVTLASAVRQAAEAIAADLHQCDNESSALQLAWGLHAEIDAVGPTVMRVIIATAASIYALDVMSSPPAEGVAPPLARLAIFCGDLSSAISVSKGPQT